MSELREKVARLFNRELDLKIEREEGARLLAKGREIDASSPMWVGYKPRKRWQFWRPRLSAYLAVELSNDDWNANYLITLPPH